MINPDLISYIESEVARGVTNDLIQNALIASGWNPIDVAEAIRKVAERVQKGESGKPYIETETNQKNTEATLTPEHPVSFHTNVREDSNFSAVAYTATSPAHIEQFTGVTITEKKSSFSIIPIVVVIGILILGGLGFYFFKSFSSSPERYFSGITKTISSAKSITFSGDYEIKAPTALVFPDSIITSSFGGITARTLPTVIKSSFFGVDDWYDLRDKKSETKINTSVTVGTNKSISFASTIRRASESIYIKLPESGALFDKDVTEAGANWVRYDKNDFIPSYAYGFIGNTKLYENAMPRFLLPLLESATSTGVPTTNGALTVIPVNYNSNIATTFFTELIFLGDTYQNSQIFGPSYTLLGITKGVTGEFSFDSAKKLRKANINIGFKAKGYDVPIEITFNLALDNFNIPPSINIPTQVVSLDELKKKSELETLPESLRSFFKDVKTVASIYKGTHQDSFKGVCNETQGLEETGTALTISEIKNKMTLSGFAGVTCRDTDTAWVFYVTNNGKYFCIDSRDFSGSISRVPSGEKCN